MDYLATEDYHLMLAASNDCLDQSTANTTGPTWDSDNVHFETRCKVWGLGC